MLRILYFKLFGIRLCCFIVGLQIHLYGHHLTEYVFFLFVFFLDKAPRVDKNQSLFFFRYIIFKQSVIRYRRDFYIKPLLKLENERIMKIPN